MINWEGVTEFKWVFILVFYRGFGDDCVEQSTMVFISPLFPLLLPIIMYPHEENNLCPHWAPLFKWLFFMGSSIILLDPMNDES